MSEQTALPDPVAMPVWLPDEWIKANGSVRWAGCTIKTKCDDCLVCIYQWLHKTAPEGARSPGVARMAHYKRTLGVYSSYHCREHAALRKEKEGGNG